MTRIDFYILPEATLPTGDTVMTVCRLCDKAVASGARVYLRAPEPRLAEEIDGALWSFRQGGFISHERDTGKLSEDPQPSILIGDGEPPATHHGILLNLGADVPLYFSSFDRVLEIVPASAADRASSRLRYKFYRDRGYEINTNNL
ncbi:MAG: polymerase subunit chi [Hydrocarboniphaga sp.]|uniref:DNA polymerase III subunit chi n=1 Tax=Hydrocarboniphaga sp. TaxID=2033016 RepID=UPI002616B67E|nr:DNA polymerase III subunit chi [Hydrocarboniphaga sp.]MDB5971464.1 polymerase subunit chi [Hydrocarboniphaga sp.]